MTLEELEREHMRRVLNEVSGDKVKAAQVLGIHLSTLYRKVQRYRLENEGTGQPAPSNGLQHACRWAEDPSLKILISGVGNLGLSPAFKLPIGT